jgi:K+-dependent Na+/Ca+ exchanger-like protein
MFHLFYFSGATLMAAGGSAPELASSLIGTFSGSDIGFGTIVGSAVFNVLFVIACCVAFTPAKFGNLKLTGWPLARDCSYYCISLLMVAFVFGVNSPGLIELWEACLLFSLYLGYCTIMYFNEDIFSYVKKCQIFPVAKEPDAEGEVHGTDHDQNGDLDHGISLVTTSRYQAGLLSLMQKGAGSLTDKVGWGAVTKINGGVAATFKQFDENEDGFLSHEETRKLLQKLGGDEIADEDVKILMDHLDTNGDGRIDIDEFTVWYISSEERLKNEEKVIFHEFDKNDEGFVHARDVRALFVKLDIRLSDDEMKQAMTDLTGGNEAGSGSTVTYDKFSDWYEASPHWEKKHHEAEDAAEAAEGVWADLLEFPKETNQENALYLLLAPITWTLGLTAGIKDVRVPGNEGWCYFQFMMSIVWIGAYSFVLVSWIQSIGATFGIPAVVMGLTLLAAGTSIPDLLSSIVVARDGRGDMAVSSSVGSNIFDVTVGLPVPWILFNLVMGCPVRVGADNLLISILVLNGMVIAVVISIMVAGWEMSKSLGVCMMVLYVIFLIQDIVRVYLFSNIVC